MRRRRFFQYTGLGSLSLAFATQNNAIASALSQIADQYYSGLENFDFVVSKVDKSGIVKHRQKRTAKFFSEPLNSAEQIAMVAIASGQFTMGVSRFESSIKHDELPRHVVDLPPFFISKYPITQGQWTAVAALPKVHRDLNPNPSHFQGLARPVESVAWLDAVEFCDRLSLQTSRRYQLPSEAQWEYACRAGTQTPFHTGETITSQLADYIGTYTYRAEAIGEYRQSTVPIGHFSPNAFGLYDMHGNVWEWCADSWHPTYRGAPTNGQAWITDQRSPLRTIRGGGWLDSPATIRSASRSGYVEAGLNRTIGFRVSVV